MRRMLITTFALAISGSLISPSFDAARADGGGDLGWLKETTDKGCYRYMAELVDTYTLQGQGFVWTGPCTAGQPISGEGTFYRQYPDGLIWAYTGRITNGFQDGPTKVALYRVTAGAFPPTGAPESEEQITFRMGCSEWIGPDCRPGSPFSLVDVPRVSPALFPLPGGPSSFSGGEPAALSPAPAPAPRRMSSTDDCVFMNGEGQTDHGWQIINKCTYPVRVKWCYEDNGPFSCAKHQSGTSDRLKPGQSQGVSASPANGALYRVGWCDDDDRDCRIPDPWTAP